VYSYFDIVTLYIDHHIVFSIKPQTLNPQTSYFPLNRNIHVLIPQTFPAIR